MNRTVKQERIIKPPVGKISSGKIFRPTKAFRNKMWVEQILVAIVFWFFIIGGWVGLVFLINFFESTMLEAIITINTWFVPLNIGMWVFNLIWLVPAIILTPIYVRSIEYSVIAESGETMPEVYVRKGIISITRKHVPFRTVTNISTMAGPFDRIFGIGNVNIETAGYSGKQQGPEEKLEGFPFYEEVRDFILQELRKFRSPYVTGTEFAEYREEPVPRLPDTLDDDILRTLREMRELLAEISRKLNK